MKHQTAYSIYKLCNVHGKWTRIKLVQKLIIFVLHCTLCRFYTFYIYKKDRERDLGFRRAQYFTIFLV